MVQNSVPEPRRRGRPREYDPETALQQVTEAFWKTGYSGTSLDDLATASGMNRPSLYAAFGDKHALYLKALNRYWELGYAAMRAALDPDHPLGEGLMRVYQSALSLYFPGRGRGRGCFAIGTANTEAAEDTEIRAAFAQGLHTLDTGFEGRFRTALENGELSGDADPETLAILASATLHSIAIRARVGASRADLEAMARKVVTAICQA